MPALRTRRDGEGKLAGRRAGRCLPALRRTPARGRPARRAPPGPGPALSVGGHWGGDRREATAAAALDAL